MRHALVGYVLGALEDSEHELVGRHIAEDSRLRNELSLVYQALEPLAIDKDTDVPPSGLARRTCDFVRTHPASAASASGISEASIYSRAATAGRTGERSLTQAALVEDTDLVRPHRWGLFDVAVAAGILAAATLLLFPVIGHSRFQARITSCQNNLADLGQALRAYSEINDGRIPEIDQQGSLAVAGIYAPRLLEAGLVTDPKTFICGGSELACRATEVEIPKYGRLVELQQTEGSQLDEVLADLGGSYAYNLGFRENGIYNTVSLSSSNGPNRNSGTTVLLADAPCKGRQWSQSSNHGGYGQNVLYADGQVRYLTGCRSPGCVDTDIYHNDDGAIAAGTHRDDVVVGNSAIRPCN